MVGVMNRTARQFNLKCCTKAGGRITIRIAPGFNIVDKIHWQEFVRRGHVDAFVAELKKAGHIDYGDLIDDMLMEMDASTKLKVKVVSPVELQAKSTEWKRKAEAAEQENLELRERLDKLEKLVGDGK